MPGGRHSSSTSLTHDKSLVRLVNRLALVRSGLAVVICGETIDLHGQERVGLLDVPTGHLRCTHKQILTRFASLSQKIVQCFVFTVLQLGEVDLRGYGIHLRVKVPIEAYCVGGKQPRLGSTVSCTDRDRGMCKSSFIKNYELFSIDSFPLA